MASPSKGQLTILLAVAQPIYRLGLKRLLGIEEDFRVIAAVEDGPEVLEAVRIFQPDVLLLDRGIPNRHPFDIVREVRQVLPKTRIILLNNLGTDEETVEAIRSGVRCVLPKEMATETLLLALRKVYNGETLLGGRALTQMVDQLTAQPPPELGGRLTTRELEITNLVTQGFRNKEIAARLFLSEQTVKNVLRNVFDKLGVSDRLELALCAVHHRLFPTPKTNSMNH